MLPSEFCLLLVTVRPPLPPFITASHYSKTRQTSPYRQENGRIPSKKCHHYIKTSLTSTICSRSSPCVLTTRGKRPTSSGMRPYLTRSGGSACKSRFACFGASSPVRRRRAREFHHNERPGRQGKRFMEAAQRKTEKRAPTPRKTLTSSTCCLRLAPASFI